MSTFSVPSDLTSKEAAEQALREIEAALPPLHAGIQPAMLDCAEQIQQLEVLSEDWLLSCPEAGNAFAWAALVLQHEGRLAEAELLLQRAVTIWRYTPSAQGAPLDEALFNLGLINAQQDRLTAAAELIQQAVLLRNEVLHGSRVDPATLLYLEKLAEVYQRQHKEAEAAQVYQKALALCELKVEREDAQTSTLRYKLAKLYLDQRQPAESQLATAEQLLRQAWEYYEKTAGPAHFSVARIVHKLAQVHMARKEWAQAEALLQGARAAIETQIKPPEQQTMLYHLAYTRAIQQKWDEETLSLLQSVSQAYAERLGPDNQRTLDINTNLALVYSLQERWEKAEPLLQQTHASLPEQPGADWLTSGRILLALAGICAAQEKHEQAMPLYEQARALFMSHPEQAPLDILHCLQGILALAHQQDDLASISRWQERLQQHWETLAALPAGPEAVAGLNGLAGLALTQGQFSQAEQLLLRALAICKNHQEIGPAGLALILQQLALACLGQGKEERATIFMQRVASLSRVISSQVPMKMR